jgi:putative ABC transport system permease protein
MYLIKLAFDNLKYNIKRSISLILIIAVTSASIILYQGYVEYSSQGMKAGYINNCGHLQIASASYWSGVDDEEKYIKTDVLYKLFEILNDCEYVKFFDSVFSFSGLIGNDDSTTIFWAKGYDNPERYYCPQTGSPVFNDDDKVIIGGALANKIYFNFDTENEENNYLSLMCNSPEEGICLSSINVAGIINTGIPQNDEGLLICSRKKALELLEMENAASYIQVFLQKDNCDVAEKALLELFEINNLNLAIKNWMEINPSYKQVNDLNRSQFIIISFILGVLIFITLMQTLSTAYLERIGEFGTLEAIGLTKTNLNIMLLTETLYLFIIGTVIGLSFALCANRFTEIFNIQLTPPGYDVSFLLSFVLVPEKILLSFLFIFLCCICATVIPLLTIKKNTAINLMHK